VSEIGYAGLDIAMRTGASAVRRVRKRSIPIQYHFDPARYTTDVAANLPRYHELQSALARATDGAEVHTVLDLGIGTGETSAAVLGVHPAALVTGLDASQGMLDVARSRLPAANVANLVVGKLQDPLPAGQFDLVVSSLAIHHLWGGQKRQLFARIHHVLAPGRRFVMADVVRPDSPEDSVTPISKAHDRPERLANLERWLVDAGFVVSRSWSHRDLIVFRAEKANGVRGL
jgi:tRNA (cmo5U34)-methyltransferase